MIQSIVCAQIFNCLRRLIKLYWIELNWIQMSGVTWYLILFKVFKFRHYGLWAFVCFFWGHNLWLNAAGTQARTWSVLVGLLQWVCLICWKPQNTLWPQVTSLMMCPSASIGWIFYIKVWPNQWHPGIDWVATKDRLVTTGKSVLQLRKTAPGTGRASTHACIFREGKNQRMLWKDGTPIAWI